MKIIMAENAGFCFGVQRAVDRVYEEAEKGGNIYTFGPIIHNEAVTGDLEKRGVKILEDPDRLKTLEKCTLIIRSHGVSKAVFEEIRKNPEIQLVDATCPFVKRIHEIVEEESANGANIVIIGNVGHAEVEGTIGWSSTGATVIETKEEAEAFSLTSKAKICIVAQTTFNAKKFEELVDILAKKGYNQTVMNTICNATNVRQQEAGNIARRVQTMIVIGSAASSNSAKLYEICKKECPATLFIQSCDDLRSVPLADVDTIGITAGASTPRNIIEEVMNYVRNGTDI